MVERSNSKLILKHQCILLREIVNTSPDKSACRGYSSCYIDELKLRFRPHYMVKKILRRMNVPLSNEKENRSAFSFSCDILTIEKKSKIS